MAESSTATLVSLNNSNYPTWKVQCRNGSDEERNVVYCEWNRDST